MSEGRDGLPEAGLRRGGVGSVGRDVGSVVTDAQGPVATGGTQYNGNIIYGNGLFVGAHGGAGMEEADSGHGGGSLTVEEVRRNRDCFVRPPGFPCPRSARASHGPATGDGRGSGDGDEVPHVLFLKGAPGSGRRGAAMQWLHLASGEVRAIRSLPDRDSPRHPVLNTGAVQQGELLFLDASLEDGPELVRIISALTEYRRVVEQNGAYLAVVFDRGQERQLSHAWRAEVHEVERPEMRALFTGHLRQQGMDPPPELVEERFGSWLDGARVDEAVDLALLVGEARGAAGERAGYARWFDDALGAVGDWANEVEKQIQKSGTSADRAVLLAAAMLDGRTAEEVFTAAESLARAVAAPEDERPPLERDGFSTRLRELGIRMGADRRVVFAKFGYAKSVRSRFWDDYPWLRDRFEEWMTAQLVHGGLRGDVRELAARHFAEQCLRVNRSRVLFDLVEHWTSTTGAEDAPAYRLLSRMLDDEHAAQAVRAWLREKAVDSEVTEVRALVINEVSGRLLLRTHPDQAIVRIHHVARRAGCPRAAQTAARALVALAGEAEHRPRVLSRLAERLPESQGETHAADVRLFWEVTAPEQLQRAGPFPKGQRERSAFRRGLTCAMVHDRAETVRHARRWLTALADGHAGEAIPALLAKAGDAAGRSPVLYTAARRWVLEGADPGERAPAATRVRDEIDDRRRRRASGGVHRAGARGTEGTAR